MSRSAGLLLAAICCTSLLLSPAFGDTARTAQIRERLPDGVLRWGGDTEGGAPFQYLDPKTEKLVGFEVDIVEALVEQLRKDLGWPELKAEFVQYEWVSLPQGLEKRDFDIVVSGMEITNRNDAKMQFTRPYYLFAQQLTVRADETKIDDLDDCRDQPIGTLSGSAADDLMKARLFSNIVTYDGQIEPYQDLRNRRVNAVLLDVPIAVYNTTGKSEFKSVGKLAGWGGYGIALRRDDDELAKVIDGALATIAKAGKVDEIVRKWNIWNVEQHQLEELTSSDKLLAWVAAQSGAPTGNPSAWTISVYGPLLLKAAGVTVALTFLSMAVAMTIGLVVAVCRLYGPGPVKWGALAYVEFFRGIPLLLLLTFLYYGLPEVGISLSAWQAAIIGFGLNYAAFEAEIYRSSIMAVPKGQWEAAQALGMSEVTAFRRVIFPQAFRTALGPMTNDFVAMFKDTSLVSVISVVELTKQYQILARTSLKFVEIGALTALLYLMMSVPLGYLARYLEDKWSTGHK
jgi:polar amino acid transport system substrate-binding protein